MTMTDSYTKSQMQQASNDFVIDFPQGVIVTPDKKFGPCENQADRWSAEWFRYSTVAVPFTLAAPGAPLVLAAETELTFFDTGTNQLGDGFGWPQSFSETDLAADGAPVKERWQYLVRAVGFQVLDPYVVSGGAGPPATWAKNYDPWIDGYKDRIRRVVMQNLAAQVTFKDGPCTWIMGLLTDYPTPSPMVGAGATSVGAGVGLQNMMPLRRAILAGPRDSIDQMNIQLVGPNAAISLASDSGNPTVSPLSVPVQVHAYGTRVKECDVDCVVSVINMLTAGQAAALSQLQANQANIPS